MVKTETDYCTFTCNGSEKDPCGAARYFTVYEQEVENGIPHNRQPKFKWITNETFAEIRNETANFYNVKCLLLNESLQSVPMFCNLNYSALCESGSERDQRTKTTDIIHVKTRSSSNEMSVISEAFTTTTSSWTKSLIPVKITTISGMM
ncbi:Hypothetical predicted protein [Mytilus galloprovincialis]|uniref:Uncharacterized protein n=1 Tax=Mytilus galloprovincialis TaxID=29158 RepID=A0A8B6GCC1_MYTGA|nr:Hypothetical predicted protein [Mytilus galloprovincialis]